MNETKKETVLTLKKIAFLALIAILLNIPLMMIQGVISERDYSQRFVKEEISKTIAESQIINGPRLIYVTEEERVEDGKTELVEKLHVVNPQKMESDVSVTTETLRRSIYGVIVYHSKMTIKGNFVLSDEAIKGKGLKIKVKVSDLKGLMDTPQINLNGKDCKFDVDASGELYTMIESSSQEQFSNNVPFSMYLDIKGTEQLMFAPSADETKVSINSAYPNPSFVGEYLPISRDVNEKGFTATWKVLKINKKNSSCFGVDFIEVASQYQQAMRSAKYGMLIICLVFVAGLLVEFVTRKQIHIVQYTVIGLSLALFYSLLTAFADIVSFGWSYLIATTMTILALSLYLKGILKNKSAWFLGGFISIMYMANYILLQMKTYSLLAGSLLLFILLAVMMYFTANMNRIENEK